MFKKILVCLDGSDLAEQIMPYAMEEAARFSSHVILLQVVTIPTMVAGAEGAGAMSQTGDLIEETVQVKAGDAKTYLEQVVEPLRNKGINVDSVVVEGSPIGDTIVNYARENQIDLICIATHGHSGLGRVVFGSITDHVLRDSRLPILLIRPQ
jgi:nucleotide-binding universal stress UspA family protein